MGEQKTKPSGICTQTGKPCGMPCFNEEVCKGHEIIRLTTRNKPEYHNK